MSEKYQLIIFDLDGTLLDTSPGIYNSVRYAEKQMGFAPIPDEQLREFVGPPPKQMYMRKYGVDEETALAAVRWHREYGREKAVYEARVYPGMEDTLTALKDRHYQLAVATLKGQKIAERVLDNFHILRYFDAVTGMDDQETRTKCETIRLSVRKVGHCERVLMVGDSVYDCIGAAEAGVDFLAVTYGFGIQNDSDVVYPHVVGTAASPCEILSVIESVAL